MIANQGTYIELFHMILDLPFMSAALERSKYEPDLMPTGDQIADVVKASRNRALLNYVLRNESGLGAINFWSSTTMPLLAEFCKGVSHSPRVLAAAKLSQAYLVHFFDTLLSNGSEENLQAIIPVIFERITQVEIQCFPWLTDKVLTVLLLSPPPLLALPHRQLQEGGEKGDGGQGSGHL